MREAEPPPTEVPATPAGAAEAAHRGAHEDPLNSAGVSWAAHTTSGPLQLTVQQALYSSALTERQAGYQLVARSGGICTALARELVGWCPTHDSLCAGSFRALSFFPLNGDHYGIGYTTSAGDEYSGRRGDCISTHLLVVTAQTLGAFSYHPLRLFDAVRAGGHLHVAQPPPKTLPEISLLAPGQACEPPPPPDEGRLAGTLEASEARGEDFTRLLTAHRQVAICGVQRPLRYAARLLDEWPQHLRRVVSFSAALRYSAQRPFRLLILGDDENERRRLRRVPGITLIESPGEAI